MCLLNSAPLQDLVMPTPQKRLAQPLVKKSLRMRVMAPARFTILGQAAAAIGASLIMRSIRRCRPEPALLGFLIWSGVVVVAPLAGMEIRGVSVLPIRSLAMSTAVIPAIKAATATQAEPLGAAVARALRQAIIPIAPIIMWLVPISLC